MTADFFARKKTRVKALLDGTAKKPIQRTPEKTEFCNGLNFFQIKSKEQLRPKSSGKSSKQNQPFNRSCLCSPTASCLESKADTIDANEERKVKNESTKASFANVLSFQNFSSGRTSIFKLRNAGSRFFFNGSSSRAENTKEKIQKKMRSTISYPSLLSPSKPSKDDLQQCQILSTPIIAELTLQHIESDLLSSSVEFLRNSPSLVKVDEESDYHSFPPLPGSDSAISDWRDHFASPETDSEFIAEKTFLEAVDSTSRSYSFTTWSTSSNGRLPKPMFNCTLKPKDIPPPGMLFAAWLNTKTGNRFKNFHLDTKLEAVIVWLGDPLPIVIQEPENSGRRCDSDLTIAQALGKLLKSPSQQGIAFFIGPVNSKLSYLMTVCDLCRLCALRTVEDEEKLQAWI